jgi:hypothetical protein
MKQFVVFFLFFSFSLQAQITVKGIVKNAETGEVLPFANIKSGNQELAITDIDGKFLLSTKSNKLSFSYIGFDSKIIPISNDKNYYIVLLYAKTQSLNEVVLNKNNPANEIIKKVIQQKNNNNPQKKLSTFQFKSYNKLVITAHPDSISNTIDSVFIENNIGKKFAKLDSSNYKFKKIIDKQHLFQTEKVSQFQFSNNNLKETILGTKMAGFSQPVYEIIAFHLQSFSVYDNNYELFEAQYNSPIAKDALNNYSFQLLDTVSLQNRKTILIYFGTVEEPVVIPLKCL